MPQDVEPQAEQCFAGLAKQSHRVATLPTPSDGRWSRPWRHDAPATASTGARLAENLDADEAGFTTGTFLTVDGALPPASRARPRARA
jgi:hypothetical protein